MPKSLVGLTLLVPTAVLSVSCSFPGGGAAASEPGRAGRRGAGAVPVVTARVQQKSVPITLPAVGTVEAISSVQIRSQVTGQVSAIHFAEGQEVQKGQPLFSLDPRPFQAALQQAQAVLARDVATLQNAQAQQARAESLFQRGLIPRDQYDSQRASATSLAATVEADKSAVESARLNVSYAEIAAPITGRTGSLGVHAGDLVRANDATPLVVINQLSPVYVTFSVPGRFLADIQRYQARKPLSVIATPPSASSPGVAPAGDTGRTLASGPATNARGVLTFIDNAMDPSTGTIRLKGTFPNRDHRLWPGAFVQVALDLTTDPDALVVPATSVQASQDGQYVFLVKPDRTVEVRPVKVERQVGDEVVIAEGVSPGDVVVTDGQLRLTPGARVSEAGDAGAPRGSSAGGGRTAADPARTRAGVRPNGR